MATKGFKSISVYDGFDDSKKIKKDSVSGRKPGRPKTKTEETKPIYIAVPVSVHEKLDTVKKCYGNNLTTYINKLIEKDLEANYDNYVNIINNLNQYL